MRRFLLGAVLVGLAGCSTTVSADPAPRTVVLTIHHSRFAPDRLTVAAGTAVRFVVRNTDPIDHELIVGDDVVQLRHELGTERHHGAKPGEVSVPAGAEASTTYTFGRAGDVTYACHLPGHFRYGMRGEITAV